MIDIIINNDINDIKCPIKDLTDLISDSIKLLMNDSDPILIIGNVNMAKNIVHDKFSNNQCHTIDEINIIFKDLIKISNNNVMTTISDDGIINDKASIEKKIISIIKEIYHDNHIILSDLFSLLSEIKFKNKISIQESLDYAGMSLSLRIKSFGLIHIKTIDSHFKIGIIYKKLNENELARKQFIICRRITAKLYGELHINVTNCDLQIGLCEKKLHNFDKAYLYFFLCYRTRCLLLSPHHNDVINAFQLITNIRSTSRQRYICSIELKDRIAELKWDSNKSDSLLYYIALYINQLGEDVIVTIDQLKLIINETVRHSLRSSKLQINNDNIKYSLNSTSGSTDTSPLSPMSTLNAPISFLNEEKIDIDGILRLLLVNTASLANNPFLLSKNGNNNDENINFLTNDDEDDKELKKKVKLKSPKSPNKKKKTTLIIEKLTTTNIIDLTTQKDINSSPTDLIDLKNVNDDDSGKFFDHYLQLSSPSNDKDNKDLNASLNLESQSPIPNLSLISQDNCNISNPIKSNTPNLFQLGYQDSILSVDNVTGKRVILKVADSNDILEHNILKLLSLSIFPWLILKNKANKIAEENKLSSIPIAPSLPPPIPPPLPNVWPPKPYPYPENTCNRLGEINSVSKPKGPKLKEIQLDILEGDVEGTIWSESESIFESNELFADFMEEFDKVKKEVKKSNSKLLDSIKVKPELKTTKTKVTSLLDPQRAQNISIMLAKFGKRNITEITGSLQDFNAEALGIGAISSLSMFLPSQAEYEVIKLHVDKMNAQKNEPMKKEFDENGDEIKQVVLKLNKAEEYIYEMGSIKNADIKLTALSASLTAIETKETIEKNAESLINAVHEVRGCSRLRYLLKSILDLGNMINKINNNPVVVGFKLSSLKKLVEIKTNSGESIEKYIVSRIYTAMPEALEIAGNMPSLDEARR
jgi:hypothetical protein